MSAPNVSSYRKILDHITDEVEHERRRQNGKFGNQADHTACIWAAILAEESGEVAQAAIAHDFDGFDTSALRMEAVQVAAVAFAIIEHCDDNEIVTPAQHPTGDTP